MLKDAVDPNELERIQGLVEDARERLLASEEATLRLQALLQSILAVVPPLVALDDRRVVAWSATLERLTGTPAASALGRPVSAVLPALASLPDGVHLMERHDGELRLLDRGTDRGDEAAVNRQGDGFASARAPG
jgi:PAS domain-containing protein